MSTEVQEQLRSLGEWLEAECGAELRPVSTEVKEPDLESTPGQQHPPAKGPSSARRWAVVLVGAAAAILAVVLIWTSGDPESTDIIITDDPEEPTEPDPPGPDRSDDDDPLRDVTETLTDTDDEAVTGVLESEGGPEAGALFPDVSAAIAGDDGAGPLPLGTVDELPSGPYLDFLVDDCGLPAEVGSVPCAAEVKTLEGGAGARPWSFHVRHGFVNDGPEPLGDGFDVVLYLTYRDGVIRFTSDYVVRGTADRCGPNFRSQTEPVSCEWFVHDFPEGLPGDSGEKYAMFAAWEAPCWAWVAWGYAETCADREEVQSLFTSATGRKNYKNVFPAPELINLPGNGPPNAIDIPPDMLSPEGTWTFTPATGAPPVDDLFHFGELVWLNDALVGLGEDGSVSRTSDGFRWEQVVELDELVSGAKEPRWDAFATDDTIVALRRSDKVPWAVDSRVGCWIPGTPLADVAASTDGQSWEPGRIEPPPIVESLAALTGCAQTRLDLYATGQRFLLAATVEAEPVESFYRDEWSAYDINGDRVEPIVDDVGAAERRLEELVAEHDTTPDSDFIILVTSTDGRTWSTVESTRRFGRTGTWGKGALVNRDYATRDGFYRERNGSFEFSADLLDWESVGVVDIPGCTFVDDRCEWLWRPDEAPYPAFLDRRGSWYDLGELGRLNIDGHPDEGTWRLTSADASGWTMWNETIGDYYSLRLVGVGDDFIILLGCRGNARCNGGRDLIVGQRS